MLVFNWIVKLPLVFCVCVESKIPGNYNAIRISHREAQLFQIAEGQEEASFIVQLKLEMVTVAGALIEYLNLERVDGFVLIEAVVDEACLEIRIFPVGVNQIPWH